MKDYVASLEDNLAKSRRLVCAIITQYGKDSEHGRYLDLEDVSMISTTDTTQLLIGFLPSSPTLRLLIPTAKPLPENPTTLQTPCKTCKHVHVGDKVCFYAEQCGCPNE